MGLYDKANIRLLDFPSASEVLRAYRNGTIDVAALTMAEVLILAAQGLRPPVVLVMDISAGGDVVLGQPGMEKLADLEGKRVGVESGALGAFVITRALELAGLKASDIEVVALEVSEHEKAFKSGAIDAVVTFEPVRTKLLAAGARQLFDSRQIPGEIVDVLAVREDVLKSHSKELERLTQGWFKAVSHLNQNPSEAAPIMAARQGITAAEFLKSLEGLQIPGREENRRLLEANEEQFGRALRKLSRIMSDQQLLPKPVPSPTSLVV